MTDHELHDAPPPVRAERQRKIFTVPLLERLRDNPGKWALAGSANNTAQASQWRKRLAPEGYEIVTRSNGDGYDYWIAYTGGDES